MFICQSHEVSGAVCAVHMNHHKLTNIRICSHVSGEGVYKSRLGNMLSISYQPLRNANRVFQDFQDHAPDFSKSPFSLAGHIVVCAWCVECKQLDSKN